MSKTAYTIGNQASYDEALSAKREVTKLGRGDDYSGGCCWPTYKEALEWVNKNKDELSFTPKIYCLILPNGWEEDTTDDTCKLKGHHSLLVDAIVRQYSRRIAGLEWLGLI